MISPSDSEKSLLVCVCTSLEAIQEPRAPRHAIWLAEMEQKINVVFMDSAPLKSPRRKVNSLEEQEKLCWLTHHFASRPSSPFQLMIDRCRFYFLRLMILK